MTDKQTAKIGVLLGGIAPERPISLKSGAAVSAALRSRGWNTVDIDVGRDLPAQIVASGITHAWLALHGPLGEDGCVQGLLEVMRIPYTGSGVRGSAPSPAPPPPRCALRAPCPPASPPLRLRASPPRPPLQ